MGGIEGGRGGLPALVGLGALEGPQRHDGSRVAPLPQPTSSAAARRGGPGYSSRPGWRRPALIWLRRRLVLTIWRFRPALRLPFWARALETAAWRA